MGASDSKLVFKKGIFRLSEERHIPGDDPYWTSVSSPSSSVCRRSSTDIFKKFWELPESAEDIFSLFAPADIRRTRDHALENLETLILVVTSRLFFLRHHPSFPNHDIAPGRDALNCIRVLTRILPYIYEKDSLQAWEEQFFWTECRKRTRKVSVTSEVLFDEAQEVPKRLQLEESEKARPLAEELIDTLIDLLFFVGLTVPRQTNGKQNISYAIWQSGVGCNSTIPTTKEDESNRCEILRLLLTLASQSMYMSAAVLPRRGVKALTHICACPDKQIVLSVLCSLLNTTLKYNPATWRVPYNNLLSKDPKQLLVTSTLQFLLVVLLYPIPDTNTPSSSQKNYYRHFMGRLHRAQDFQFIFDGMTRILNQPLQANVSYIPGTQSSVKFAPEILMLFWEITQCNKRFRSFIVDTERAQDFVIIILFYALEYKNDASKQGVVRMCAFLLQTLSVEKNFGVNLNKIFTGQDTLPTAVRIREFEGTYADFLILSIYSLITKSQERLTAIYPALLAVINNIAPHLEGLSSTTSTKLMQLFSSMSSPSFLLANESNHDLLRSLLESINSIIEHQYQKNPKFICCILKNRKRFEALRSFTLESGREEIEKQKRKRKDNGGSSETVESNSSRSSVESLRSPLTPHARVSSLTNVPEEDGTFAIGDDEDDSDDDVRPTPAPSSPSENPSQASSVASAAEDDVPRQLRGMSEKARGKMPAGAGNFLRQNSATSPGGFSGLGQSQGGPFEPDALWIDSWLPDLPLHTILNTIQQLGALMLRQSFELDTPSSATLAKAQEIRIVGIEKSAVRVHTFEWSPLALGWYESLIWSFIFTNEMQVAKGTVGIWNATAIKLFRVQETAPEGPTFTSPRGAVDAVGSNIVSRIGSINLRGTSTAPIGGTPSARSVA